VNTVLTDFQSLISLVLLPSVLTYRLFRSIRIRDLAEPPSRSHAKIIHHPPDSPAGREQTYSEHQNGLFRRGVDSLFIVTATPDCPAEHQRLDSSTQRRLSEGSPSLVAISQIPEPDWESHTQKVRAVDGAALFRCVWQDEKGERCNYVSKKQLVKRHVLATHLEHRFRLFSLMLPVRLKGILDSRPYPCTFVGCHKAFSQKTSRDTHALSQ
jgi:hypothetical protein